MNACQTALLSLVKAALFGGEAPLPEETDWEAVLSEAKSQAVASLVAPVVPGEARARFANSVLQNKAHLMQILYEQKRLLDLFREKRIPAVVLKGTAAAVYYPVPAHRTAGDIDLLVKPVDFDRAKDALAENGCAFLDEYYRHAEFDSGSVIVELHRQYSFADADVEDLLTPAFDRAVTMAVYGFPFRAFPAPENGLILLDHMRHHFVDCGLGLRHLADWALFVNREMTPELWENAFLPLAEKAELLTFARVLTRAAVLYLGLPDEYPWCREAGDDVAAAVMDRFFAEGNFGAKTEKSARDTQEAALALRKQGFFRGLQSAGLVNWKATQKHAFLRPFAWVYQLFRYIRKGFAALFSGKKLTAALNAGRERADLYSKLGIKK